MTNVHFITKFIKQYLLLLVIILCPVVSAAQQTVKPTGSISGVVKDAKGHTLPGVSIEILKHGQLQRGAVTNNQGQYAIHHLPAGTYTITFSFIGFKTVKKRIKVKAGQTLQLNVKLQ